MAIQYARGNFAPRQYAERETMTADLEILEKKITPNYISIKVSAKKFNQINLMDVWCYETGCGKRINMDSFAFKTEAELTMFTLKWNPGQPKVTFTN